MRVNIQRYYIDCLYFAPVPFCKIFTRLKGAGLVVQFFIAVPFLEFPQQFTQESGEYTLQFEEMPKGTAMKICHLIQKGTAIKNSGLLGVDPDRMERNLKKLGLEDMQKGTAIKNSEPETEQMAH